MSLSRPYVICHMASTIDGRIITEHWGNNLDKYSKLYEQCHQSFNSQAWMVGRVTMEKDFTKGFEPELNESAQPIAREPFVGDKEATSFAVAIDPKGKLGWQSADIDGDHVVAVLLEDVSDSYLGYLQQVGVSYIFAGKDEVVFSTALNQLYDVFGIKTMMLEGGGNINGSLLSEGLIDEVSLLIVPLADGSAGAATVFDMSKAAQTATARELKLISSKQLSDDVLWLKYKVIIRQE
jgi:riboflavin biosynthesis pyrimidine reductase